MSTDIIKYPQSNSGKPERVFSVAALKLYLAISVPFMLITFLGAWIFYYQAIQGDEKIPDTHDHDLKVEEV
jgi:hypothetical protein